VGLVPAIGAPAVDCVTVDPGMRPAVIRVPPEGLLLTARASGTQAALHRFASESFPVALSSLPRGRQELLRIPPDRSPQPWSIQLAGGGPLSACRPGAA
jgi:hypothetical protein